MSASLVSDCMMGLGCMTFTFALMAGGAFLIAVRLGLLPGLVERLKQFCTQPPSKADDERALP